MKLLLTLALLLITSCCFAQDNWKLIYENDAEGNTIHGKLGDLIAAIQNGENVRIYFRMGRIDQPEIYVEHTALVKFTTVMNAPEVQFVTAQIDPIIGQVPDFEKQQLVLKENLEWSSIASTNGKNDTMTRNVITGEIIRHAVVKRGTKWFVEKK